MRWEWSRSRSKSGGYRGIADAEAGSYTPTSDDVGYYLRATVSYRDREGTGKSAVGTSANEVKAINSPNAGPVFPDQDPDMPLIQNDGNDEDGGGECGCWVTTWGTQLGPRTPTETY